MDISDLPKGDARTAVLDFGAAGELNLTWRGDKMNLLRYSHLNEVDLKWKVSAVAELVTSWNLTENGQPVAIDALRLQSVPLAVIAPICEEIVRQTDADPVLSQQAEVGPVPPLGPAGPAGGVVPSVVTPAAPVQEAVQGIDAADAVSRAKDAIG